MREIPALLFPVLLASLIFSGCASIQGGSGGGGNTPLSIATTTLPNGQVGVAYNATLTASGGKAPYSWSLMSGSLPAGLSLNSATGAITGTATATANSVTLTFQVTDSENPAQKRTVSLTLTVSPASLAISTNSLANGQVSVLYSATLMASGGTPPYTWSLTSGTLPAGLSLNAATGAITGTPTATVTSTQLTFQVQDSANPQQTRTVNLTLTILPAPPVISTSSLPNGQVGAAYNTTLTATSGTPPYTWAITSGALPAGLTLNSSTGVISGTPTSPVTNASLTFKVTDSGTPAQSAPKTLTLTIAPATLAISTASLPNGQVGVAYSATLAATGGTTPFTWSVISGSLPAGLSLNASTGAITGTPTTAVNNAALTFQVKDSGSPQQIKTVNLTLTITPATLVITTTSLPNGQINVAYTATLAATGGTTPYTWSLISGTLPNGLSLNAATGGITGTPTVSVANTPLTFQVQDSGSPQQTKTVNLALTIGTGGNITVSLSPKRAGLTITQGLTVTATTNDAAGVTWTSSGSSCSGNACGTFSSGSSQTGVGVTYTAPSSAGSYTITATSVTDVTVSSSITIGVTDLVGVFTYHNDLSRDGVNSREYALNTTNVATATFGKLFSCSADAAIYAQPLWVANLNIGGGKHNVVVAATVHDTVYAFDADASPCVPYWSKSLLGNNETWVSNSDVSTSDIFPDIGIIGTPVIDPSTNTLYVVAKSKTNGTSCTPASSCFQRLHALSLIDGSEKFGGPANISSSISVPGTGDGSSGGTVTFNTLRENQRPGLVLSNGVVYVSWASHGDNGPYHGWVIGFNASTLAITSTFNANPNGSDSGIWMSGGAPAVDASGNIYFLTGNGTFDAASGGSDYGDSTVKLSTSGGVLSVASYFTPADQAGLEGGDTDHGSGGAAILVDLPSGAHPHLVIGGGKEGNLFLLDRDNLGGYGANASPADSNAVQKFSIGNGIFSTAAFFNNSLYIAGSGGHLKLFAFNSGTGQFNTAQTSQSSGTFGFPGATPSISAQGTSNAIVWATNSNSYGTSGGGSRAAAPAVLHAYDATNLNTELWNSSQASGNRDQAGNCVKFTVPTVANGKAYIGTRGNDTTTGSGTVFGEIDVYGLLPN